jgi:hypothetical protein
MVYRKLSGDQQDAQEWYHFFLEAIDHIRSQYLQNTKETTENHFSSSDELEDDDPILTGKYNNSNGEIEEDDKIASFAQLIIPKVSKPAVNNNYVNNMSVNGVNGNLDLFTQLRIPFLGSLESHLFCGYCKNHVS